MCFVCCMVRCGGVGVVYVIWVCCVKTFLRCLCFSCFFCNSIFFFTADVFFVFFRLRGAF